VRRLLCLLLLCISTATFAFEVPVLKGRVNDYANLLSEPVQQQLEEKLKQLEDKTTAQVAILTTKDLQGTTIEEYSMKVVESWQLGQKGKDNGLLITYAVDGDMYRIEVGYGLEGAIPDGKAGDIIRDQLRAHANPKENTHDFDQAFTVAVETVSGIIYTEYEKDPTGESMRGSDGTVIVVIFLLIISLFICAFISEFTTEVVGGVVGALCGAGIGISLMEIIGIPLLGFIALSFVIGLISKYILEAFGSGGSGSYSSGGSGSFGGGFSGGGGGFGGGGASG